MNYPREREVVDMLNEMDTQEEIDRRMEALKGTPWGEALR